MRALRGVSPPSPGLPTARSGKGSLGPLLLPWGSPAVLSGEGSLEFILLAAGFPRPRLGAQPRVPPPGYGVPHGREWERGLGSLSAAGEFPPPREGAQRGGPFLQANGFLQPGWELRMQSRLRAEGFLGPGVGSQREAPPPGCGVPTAPGGNPACGPLLRFGSGDGASLPGAAAAPTHLRPTEAQALPAGFGDSGGWESPQPSAGSPGSHRVPRATPSRRGTPGSPGDRARLPPGLAPQPAALCGAVTRNPPPPPGASAVPLVPTSERWPGGTGCPGLPRTAG
ncbi:collagen alpha-1(III) chain-like [Mesocricetus auratus]|uniref:Collagen alpha-1(III) chain-like n=1 Tax=Mesocricetus auratus TaxID=10036 RepID=A0A3Q0CIU4_MESAU|nr:collagen alpha-1(III) chain-like [Mesocricetus auratus]